MPLIGSSRARSEDVRSVLSSFSELHLSEPVLAGLSNAGFERPSPVQLAAIPPGRFGADLVVQAKSGTGKTAVFGVVCAESVKVDITKPQALIVAPTREIALQIRDVCPRPLPSRAQVVSTIGASLPPSGLVVEAFVGGLPLEKDKARLTRPCHVVVGSPGRLRALLEGGGLPSGAVRLLVLDEADSLMADSFLDDVGWIHDALPARKQVMAFSATYSAELLGRVEALMRTPQRVMLCSDTVALRSVHQYSVILPGGLRPHELAEAKCTRLLALMGSVSFHQAVVFCNNKARAAALARRLTGEGFPAAFISGDQQQQERMAAMEHVRSFRLRVLVSTDLVARGVDLDRVNLVVNLDVPQGGATYMHRVGRTGRFGTSGVAVTMATAEELAALEAAIAAHGGAARLAPLPEVVPAEHYAFELEAEDDRAALERLQQEAPKLAMAEKERARAAAAAAEAEEVAAGEVAGTEAGAEGADSSRQARHKGVGMSELEEYEEGYEEYEEFEEQGAGVWNRYKRESEAGGAASGSGGNSAAVGSGGWEWDGQQWVAAEPHAAADTGWEWDRQQWVDSDTRTGAGEARLGPSLSGAGEEWHHWCWLQLCAWSHVAQLPPAPGSDDVSWRAFLVHCGSEYARWANAWEMVPPPGWM